MTDLSKLADGIFASVKGYIARGLEPVIKRLEALEVREPIHGNDGKDGKNGIDGAPGKGFDGKDGRDGEKGDRGEDGKSITAEDVRPILESELSKWALEFERRSMDVLQRSIDRIPSAKDGQDGMSVDDFDIETLDGGRTIAFKMKCGDREVVRYLRTEMMIHREIFKLGKTYETGDAVTYGGSIWIAKKDTSESPGNESSGWKLSLKRGRDGKDAA